MNVTTGSFTISIGNMGLASDTNMIRIGTDGIQTTTYIAGISGVTVPGGVGVIIDSSGHLGTIVSSSRFKEAIKPMDKVSEAILGLQPVTFHYKKDFDPQAIPQFGLVAEDVAKVDSELVARDKEGMPYTVRYEAVNVMLLNEFLKQHRAVQDLKNTLGKQEAMIAQQREEIHSLTAAVKAQAAQIQKVSDQIAASQTIPLKLVKNR